MKDKKTGKSVKTSYIKGNDKKAKIVPAELFESLGTLRFMNLIIPVMRALQEGGVLVVDEFDTSIHPMAIMNLINVFHNDEINQRQAQLIFNTHNPIFLNSTLFRRDEIKFVEYGAEGSEVYALSDFGTGANGVRKGEDYLKNYFINKYGAIQEVDFSDFLKDVVEEKMGGSVEKM